MGNHTGAILVSVALAVAFCLGAEGKVKDGFRGYKVYRVIPSTEKHAQFLVDLQKSLDAHLMTDEIDIWTDTESLESKANQPAVIMVSPEHQQEMLQTFDAEGLRYEETVADLAKLIEEESRPEEPTSKNGGMTWTAYHSYSTIESFVQWLTVTYPTIVSTSVIGQSYEGRNMHLSKIGNPRSDGKTKPAVWMDSQIHAREWIASATLTYMMNELITGYGSNSTYRRLLDEVDIYVLWVINVDGFEWTKTSSSERLWRTTRRVNPFAACLGADPNRNLDFKWMHSGAVQSPCTQTYAGAYPFSEIENVHHTEAYLARRKQIKMLLTFHSFSQVWLTPWGFDSSLPADYQELYNLGVRATNALRVPYGTVYRVGSSTALLGAAAGATDDWAKSKGMTKYSYTVELRPNSGGSNGFILPPNQIIPSGIETLRAIIVCLDQIISEYGPYLTDV